jgi:hypothetical protein
MIRNDITMRMFARYQSLFDAYDEVRRPPDAEGGEPERGHSPLVRIAAMIRAARESGIVAELPDELADGNPLDQPYSQSLYELMVSTAMEIREHLDEAKRGPTTGES